MGGEITWECLPNGNYRFIMRVYRECQGCSACFQTTEYLATNAPGFPSSGIAISLYPSVNLGKKDLSPACNANPDFYHITCYPAPFYANTGAVEEYTYTTDLNYPNGVDLAAGPIPAGGWYFAFSGSLRNPCTNYYNSSNQDWWLRAVMFAYPGQSPDNCWDNSPVFGEKPLTVNCTGYPFTYNPIGSDKEMDSLTYEWSAPMTSQTAAMTGNAPGYSYTSPLPGTAQNVNNVPAMVDLHRGEVSFTSFNSGAFITAYKVTAFKCGTKIAEIFREMQIVLLNCPTGPSQTNNLPPDVTPPFQNPSTGIYTEFVDTVVAGSLVDFNLNCADAQLQTDGTTPQNVSLAAWGTQFGSGFSSDSSGCLHPPCATLTPAPPITNTASLSTHFRWQTDIVHMQAPTSCSPAPTYRSYDFTFNTSDDFCPIPAKFYKRVTIVLKEPTNPPAGAGPISGPITACKSGNTLTYTVAHIENALHYHWSLPPGFSGSSTTNTIVVTTNGAITGNVSVYGYNNFWNGPASSLNVKIVPLINAGPDQTIYSGSYAVLTATANLGNSPYTYSWSNGSSNDSTIVMPLISTNYIVTVTDAGGCKNMDTVMVHVQSGGNVAKVSLPNDTSCAGIISVPIKFSNFQNVDSLFLSFSYTPNLTYTGYSNVNSLFNGASFSVMSQNNKVTIKWHSLSAITFAEIQAVILQFTYTYGSAPMAWELLTPGACSIYNSLNQSCPLGAHDGSLTPGSCATLSGDLHYTNSQQTALKNTHLDLYRNGILFGGTMTQNDGSFIFPNLPTGSYSLQPQCTKAWGGVNAADALAILKHFVGLYNLSSLPAKAADVDQSSYINSQDALLIGRRFVSLIATFPLEDWVYWNTTIQITDASTYLLPVKALCAGDANGSYIP